MATIQVKSLAQGQLPAVKTALRTAAGPMIVKNLHGVNRDTLVRTINFYKKVGGVEILLNPMNLQLGGAWRVSFEDENFTLSAGDQILGECDLASIVDYGIDGTEET